MPRPKALIIDGGEYTALATRLASEMDVGYFSPWAASYPLSAQLTPGLGIKGVHRVNDPVALLTSAHPPDLVIVPDLYQNDLERLARHLEIPTFGSGEGNQLETDRWFLKEFLTEHDLPVIRTIEVVGIDELREFLEDPANEDKWIKVSVFRGDLNTFHHKKWSETSIWWHDIARRLGPIGHSIRFIIEDPIPSAVELSIEGFFINGLLLTPFLIGYEVKDAGEFALFCQSVDELPEPCKIILADLSEYFHETQYCNFFAIELRILDDGTTYLTDVACRIPVPPGYALMYAVENLPDVIGQGAAGRVERPIVTHRYLTEIKLKSAWVVENFLKVTFPTSTQGHIALEHYFQMKDEIWIIPHVPQDPEMDSFGSVFGFGDTPAKAIEECQKKLQTVEAYQMVYDDDVLEKATEQMERGSRLGLPK